MSTSLLEELLHAGALAATLVFAYTPLLIQTLMQHACDACNLPDKQQAAHIK